MLMMAVIMRARLLKGCRGIPVALYKRCVITGPLHYSPSLTPELVSVYGPKNVLIMKFISKYELKGCVESERDGLWSR